MLVLVKDTFSKTGIIVKVQETNVRRALTE